MVLSLGEATLTLSQPGGSPIAHWSLPALERVSKAPPTYAPGIGAPEALRVEDGDMVAAIERVRRAVRRPRYGRWIRLALVVAAAAGLGAAAHRIGTGPLYARAAASLPPAVRAAMGREMLEIMEAHAGARCDTPSGSRALDRLVEGVLGEGRRAVVLPGWDGAAALPGGTVVLGREAVEGSDNPSAAAGWLVAADLGGDPMQSFLADAGPSATVRAVTTGAAPRRAVEDHVARVLEAGPPEADPAPFLSRMDAAGLSVGPYARMRGDPVLYAADPHPGGGRAPLGDAEWIALSSICG